MTDAPKAHATRERLTELLRAKVEAQKVYSASLRKCDAMRDDTSEEKIDADLACARACIASCDADRAYHDALVAFGQQEENQ